MKVVAICLVGHHARNRVCLFLVSPSELGGELRGEDGLRVRERRDHSDEDMSPSSFSLSFHPTFASSVFFFLLCKRQKGVRCLLCAPPAGVPLSWGEVYRGQEGMLEADLEDEGFLPGSGAGRWKAGLKRGTG